MKIEHGQPTIKTIVCLIFQIFLGRLMKQALCNRYNF